MSSTKRRRGEFFFPEEIEKHKTQSKKIEEDVQTAFQALRGFELQSLMDNNVAISEDEALALLASKLTFIEVLNLKFALNHVPSVYMYQERGTSVPLRMKLISDILKASSPKWESFTQANISTHVDFLERYCSSFSKATMGLNEERLWMLTKKSQSGHQFTKFISPPLQDCLKCGTALQMHRLPSKAIIYGTSGPLPATKVTLECRDCTVQYGLAKYSDSTGKHFYPGHIKQQLVEISNVTYMEKDLYRWIPSLGNHCWVSFSGFAEAYNEVFIEEIETFKQYISSEATDIPFEDPLQESVVDDEQASDIPSEDAPQESMEDDEQVSTSANKQCKEKGCLPGELSSKVVAQSYWVNELEEELKDLGVREQWVFSKDKGGLRGSNEDAMQHIEKLRCESLYSHTCSANCQRKGCGQLYVADGNWKLKYAHCMWHVPITVNGFAKPLNYPSICPSSPKRGMAFCIKHCEIAKEAGMPCGLHDFLKYCGIGENDSASMQSADEKVSSKLSSVKVTNQELQFNATSFQGTETFIQEHGKFLMQECQEAATTTIACNKDTGGRKTLHSWSRGVFVVVSGGGHIDYWQPLYRSESPTQAFLVMILWLYRKFKPLLDAGKPVAEIVHQMSDTVIAYDNMCHVDRMTIAKHQLPFPQPLSDVWLHVVKVIDRLHIRNHKDKRCKTDYNPEGKIPEHYNTMAAEQTFVWASRLKKIVCAMPRIHQFFYLHRAVKRRNLYTERCHFNNKVPLLPKKLME